MQTRRAKLSDIETLFEIRTSVKENHQSRAEIAELGITPASVAEMLQTNCCAWVAEINDRIVGFSIANDLEKTILGMFVLPEFEGHGAGRALMRSAEDWLWSKGHEEIWLITGNDPALRAYGFYQHLGWQAVGVQEDGEMKFIKQRSD
ncbi:GCN5-related N-acetyltransferase [Thalassoporum mexicanum PCC 7367]|uniref:GNAT family N-acetyltransferase n=1 Tax=Thalassoporum mexicanum TaxID=3457544 RepID=UPI00029FE34E|nr:GNAT family N-acetyltransferase [Pseudanabaena sp. PCC 7367]AFY71334.1 GCN5-related N-acetyltransferase [Pseudanabaena sp. PCC 7367]